MVGGIELFNRIYMEASEPKSVNPVLNTIGVNSLRLGGLHISLKIKMTPYRINMI